MSIAQLHGLPEAFLLGAPRDTCLCFLSLYVPLPIDDMSLKVKARIGRRSNGLYAAIDHFGADSV